MMIIVDRDNRTREHVALRSMFEARKRIFVDLLKWDIPVLADRFEVDQFDDLHATYLIVTGDGDSHLASARLLPTSRPAILDTHFAHLVAGPVPRGEGIAEVTRFCLSRDLDAATRRGARDLLLAGLVDHALAAGIHTLTGVADVAWFRQIETFGWNCRALGEPCIDGGKRLTALAIAIDSETPARLAAAGIRAGGAAGQAAAA